MVRLSKRVGNTARSALSANIVPVSTGAGRNPSSTKRFPGSTHIQTVSSIPGYAGTMTEFSDDSVSMPKEYAYSKMEK
jgi:hypothetical protein